MQSANPDHWQNFYKFCHYELLAGGPDPHMACVGHIGVTMGLNNIERAWLGALYASVYNVPTALVLFDQYPDPDFVDESVVCAWLMKNWAGIAFRRERKSVRSPKKLAKCIASFALFCCKLQSFIDTWKTIPDRTHRFETAFDDVCSQVYGVGRYIGQKWLEYGRRYCSFDTEVQDIRAKNGWSPREGLALLYPQQTDLLIHQGDSPQTVLQVETLAAETRNTLVDLFDLDLSFYNLQVLLCDYKQSYVGKRQYPGRSQDSELEYSAKITPHWRRTQRKMFSARNELFPPWALGELQGWSGVRKPLGSVLFMHGYTWSDSLYNWEQSCHSLNYPKLK